MKISQEITNGFLMFLGIGSYFLLMEVLGLSSHYILRIFNVLIVIYFLNKTIKFNIQNNKKGYLVNMSSAALTGVIGIVLGIIGLALYIQIRGIDVTVARLSKEFLFGGNPTLGEYCISLLFEGLASVLMVVFINVQYWQTKGVFKN